MQAEQVLQPRQQMKVAEVFHGVPEPIGMQDAVEIQEQDHAKFQYVPPRKWWSTPGAEATLPHKEPRFAGGIGPSEEHLGVSATAPPQGTTRWGESYLR